MPSRSPVASSFALLTVGQCLAAALACLALSALQLFTACQLTLVAICGAFVNCGNRLSAMCLQEPDGTDQFQLYPTLL